MARAHGSPRAGGLAGRRGRVVLTHERIDSLSGFAAGWHAHLDMLEGLLDGRPVDWQERWDELRPRYEEVMSG